METREVAVREARARFAELIDDAERGDVTFVTRHGRRAAAIAPAALLEGIVQAAGVARTAPDTGIDFVFPQEDGTLVVMQAKRYRVPEAMPEGDADGADDKSSGQADWGRPGQGNSTLLARTVHEAIGRGKRVLIFDSADVYRKWSASAVVVEGDALGELLDLVDGTST